MTSVFFPQNINVNKVDGFNNTSIKWMSSLVHKVEKFNNKSIKWTSALLNKVDEVIEANDFITWTTSE